MMKGVHAFHTEIVSKGYRYMRPGLETTPWGTLETGVIDPFGNLIRFCERVEQPTHPNSVVPVGTIHDRVEPAGKSGHGPL